VQADALGELIGVEAVTAAPQRLEDHLPLPLPVHALILTEVVTRRIVENTDPPVSASSYARREKSSEEAS
jgi:hypothetical protein